MATDSGAVSDFTRSARDRNPAVPQNVPDGTTVHVVELDRAVGAPLRRQHARHSTLVERVVMTPPNQNMSAPPMAARWFHRLGLLLTAYAIVACKSDPPNHVNTNKTTNLRTVAIADTSTDFYIATGSDSAVLGFSFRTAGADIHYCPMYGSTYAGIPDVTLTVFATRGQKEMWVGSSWPGSETLASHRLGSSHWTTQYGETSSDTPVPQTMSGDAASIPTRKNDQVAELATFEYQKKYSTANQLPRDGETYAHRPRSAPRRSQRCATIDQGGWRARRLPHANADRTVGVNPCSLSSAHI